MVQSFRQGSKNAQLRAAQLRAQYPGCPSRVDQDAASSHDSIVVGKRAQHSTLLRFYQCRIPMWG
eukprot:3278261-Rhodomonas_salina.1